MSETLSAIFWGVLTFSILVFLHEGGHFISARAFGIKVHEFFIGLPGPSLSFKRKGTRYGLTAIPLGGYVRIAGMEGDPSDERIPALLQFISTKERFEHEELVDFIANLGPLSQDDIEKDVSSLLNTLSDWDRLEFNEEDGFWYSKLEHVEAESFEDTLERAKQGTYLSLIPLKRITILLSGVFVNIVVAISIFTLILSSFGYFADFGAIKPVTEGPAAEAGLKVGDRITAIEQKKVKNFEEISSEISKHEVGERISLDYERGKEARVLEITLGERPEVGGPYLGIGPELEHVEANIFEAFKLSFSYIWLTLKAIAGFFNPATFAESAAQSSSIVGISVLTAKAAQSSILDYAWVVAAISLSLGIMNALPIPPLDGGKVLMEVIGAVRKRDVSPRIQTAASLIGFVLLLTFVIFLTYKDIARLIGS